jgi:hypothetical protein
MFERTLKFIILIGLTFAKVTDNYEQRVYAMWLCFVYTYTDVVMSPNENTDRQKVMFTRH